MLRSRLQTHATLALRSARLHRHSSTVAPLEGLPYKSLRVGVVAETFPGEKRVAGTPESVALLIKKGYNVTVQSGAGLPVRLVPDPNFRGCVLKLPHDYHAGFIPRRVLQERRG